MQGGRPYPRKDNWYLTSVQAGFEPWQNGTGLAVTTFSSTVNTGSSGDPGGPGGSSACKVAYATNAWQGGFTADVTITNTGSSPVSGWKLAFTLPFGQRITNAWNAHLSGSSGAVTASNVAHNGEIAAGGQVAFGFQGTSSGTFVKPSDFSLNGTACTTGRHALTLQGPPGPSTPTGGSPEAAQRRPRASQFLAPSVKADAAPAPAPVNGWFGGGALSAAGSVPGELDRRRLHGVRPQGDPVDGQAFSVDVGDPDRAAAPAAVGGEEVVVVGAGQLALAAATWLQQAPAQGRRAAPPDHPAAGHGHIRVERRKESSTRSFAVVQ